MYVVQKSVVYSESGSNYRSAEEQTWINFVDFLDECEGNLIDYVSNRAYDATVYCFIQEGMFHVR